MLTGGRRPPFVLVDAGEGNDAYAKLLKGHLEDEHALDSDIVITHEHEPCS